MNYSKFGDIVEETNLIPSKVMLLKPKWKELLKLTEKDYYDFKEVMNFFKQKNSPIKVIIDLTTHNSYYEF